LELDVAQTSPSDAADILFSIARNHWVTLFEYFRTDKVGHARIDGPTKAVLGDLDELFSGLLDDLDPTRDTLLITSDHGNVEDVSHTQHTRNPVPLIAYGWAAPFFADATTLTDVTPALIEAVRASCSTSNDTA
jgi:Phosphoglyceromutase